MDEDKYFKQIRNLRKNTIKLLETISESKARSIPEGFNNHIWWNAGHVLLAWDGMTYPYMNKNRKLPDLYYRMFPKGTRPSEWNENPPTFQQVLFKLNGRIEEIIEECRGELEKPLAMPFIPRVNTMEKMIKFLIKEETHRYEVIEKINQSTPS